MDKKNKLRIGSVKDNRRSFIKKAGLGGLGLGLPLVLRQRLPGEGLMAVALGLALLLSFAI